MHAVFRIALASAPFRSVNERVMLFEIVLFRVLRKVGHDESHLLTVGEEYVIEKFLISLSFTRVLRF